MIPCTKRYVSRSRVSTGDHDFRTSPILHALLVTDILVLDMKLYDRSVGAQRSALEATHRHYASSGSMCDKMYLRIVR